MPQATATTKPKRIQKLRLITSLTALEKKRAEKLAKEQTQGDVGELVRDLLRKEHLAHVAARKKAKEKAAKAKAKTGKVSAKTKTETKLSATRAKSLTKKSLVSSSHVTPAKPAGKRAASNAAGNRTKSSSTKRVVAAKSSRKRTGTTAKKR